MTTPPRPSFLHALIMIEPMSAQVRSPLPSITRMSPGFAIEIAAWIMRLSPARTSIVNAGPARRIAGETGAMRPSSVPRRPATSARMDAANVAALRTTSGETRSKSRRMSDNAAEALSFM